MNASSEVINYFLGFNDNQLIISFIAFIILHSMMTIVHESGHYYAAKIVGVGAQEFTLGSGPVAVSFPGEKTGCRVSIRLIPLGGRVLYDNRFWDTNNLQRAFMSLGGWIADCVLALTAISITVGLNISHPISLAICALLVGRSLTTLLPFTSDGRRTIHYFRSALRERN